MDRLEKSENNSENRLGTMPVGRLLFSMSVPTMFSMLVQALYNVVDSIFVSRVSEAALTAVSLAFPMQNLFISFAVGISVGTCSVISRRLGEKKGHEATEAADTGLIYSYIFSAVFMVIGIFFTKPFMRIYTSDPDLVSMGHTYLTICLVGAVGGFVLCYTEKVLQATGDTIHPMIIQLSGAIFNILFDPVFIFGWFGLPAMGVAGAALATVVGQLLSMFIGIRFVHGSRYIKVCFSHPVFAASSSRPILEVGIPSIIMQGIGTLMTSMMNGILIAYNVLATTAFGVLFKLQSFVFMPVFGMNSGLMPILGYNYGAQNRQRMLDALKLGVIAALLIMSVGTVLFWVIPDVFLGLFNASDELLRIGCRTLRLVSISFPLASLCIMLGAMFQAMGDGYLSMIVSIVRQIGVLIPTAWLFGKLWGLDAVWFSYITAEIFSLTLTVVFFRKEIRKLN